MVRWPTSTAPAPWMWIDGDPARARLRASGDVDEDDSVLEAYNALPARQADTAGLTGRAADWD